MESLRFVIFFCLFSPLSFLPLAWSQAIGAYFGSLLIKYNKKRAHIACCNIRIAFPHLDRDKQKELFINTVRETGKWLIESPYIWFKKPNYLIRKITVTNPDLLDYAYKKKRGVVLIVPHLGNWELLNFYIPQHYPFGAIYKPIKSTLFEKIIFHARSRTGSSLFPTDSRGIRQALKALKKDSIVAVLADHLPSAKAAVYAPFFNRYVLTGKLTHSLVRSNNSPVLIASVLRKPKGLGFNIIFSEVFGMDTDSLLTAATILNKAIENSISLAPEQYQWVYHRFAHPPEGVTDAYNY